MIDTLSLAIGLGLGTISSTELQFSAKEVEQYSPQSTGKDLVSVRQDCFTTLFRKSLAT